MKLQSKIENTFPQDKLLHFIGGGFIFELSMHICLMKVQYSFWYSVLLSVSITLVAAVLKELYDKLKKKTVFDWYDILATISGISPRFIIIGITAILWRVFKLIF